MMKYFAISYAITVFFVHSYNFDPRQGFEEQSSRKNGDKVFKRNKYFFQSTNPVFNAKHQKYNIPQKSERNDVKETEQCNHDFIKQLSHLLKLFNISMPLNAVENLRTFIKMKTASKGEISGLQFAIILNMKQIYSEFDEEEIERKYEADNLTPEMRESVVLKNFEKHTIDSVKLVLIVDNNFHANKSYVQIKYDVNFVHDHIPPEPEKMYGFSEREEILRNIFGHRRKWKANQMKVEKFSTGFIFIGTFLGVLSSILCGLSFTLKKWSLIKMGKHNCYYFDRNWWFAQSLMIIGDILHFMAFYFAPTIIVCSLQILTVVVTAISSSSILEEKMHKYGKLAFALSISGCWVIIFHAPNEPHVYSIDAFLHMLSNHVFLIYVTALSLLTVLLISFWIPKYGKINSLGYTIQSAIFGSVTVLGLKGLVLGYTDTFAHWLPWISLSVVTVLLLLQLQYLNKALSMYNTLVVTAQYYVLYSAFVIFASSLFFNYWVISSYETIFTNICGFYTVGLGTLILTIFEEKNATFDFSRLFAGPEKRNAIRHAKS